ncbi:MULTISPECIES: DUF5980 family protein [Actinoalloteichus]|uniref:Uncharacterized protein n=1 Tax=Actinoalloteichus fjordicus TaxID=1612552 RepID=A0AAC9LEQ2_9PSEU|nr:MULTISPECIES: DUF5980 family protein [Actinoalloteichus]APU15377.1 hypothetical protein UA74_16735 [Actinoalloteichus fjordicus]APU21444.1 hypothetical protein UA75_17270 [Actinoalloteichus sp. GBA129-24]
MRTRLDVMGVAVGLVGMLLAGAPAAASSGGTTESGTWYLDDFEQRLCVVAERGWRDTYVWAPIFGEWSTPIIIGVRNMPAGSTSPEGTIAPGSHPGPGIRYFAELSLAPAPVGVYHAEVWADDGTVTQTAPVRLNYQERCP